MGVISRPVSWLATGLDRSIGWDRLPRSLGLVTLIGIRDRLRRKNLYDTGLVTASPEPPAKLDVHTTRTFDGSFNDLAEPRMGSIGTRFGRNVPRKSTLPEHDPLQPNPRVVSRELLTRTRFIPAWSVNLLAAAWIQFEVHDWFSHQLNNGAKPWSIELEEDDPWGKGPMLIQRTLEDPIATGTPPPAFATSDSHWWDGSQLYGGNEAFARQLRTGARLTVDAQGIPPLGRWNDPLAGSPGAANFWLGLGLMHTLFTLEHNAICDRLQTEYPAWDDEQLYQRARLINAALMAKIHTVEWTPAIIAHPTTVRGMHATWYGLAESLTKRFGRLGGGDLLSGVPGSRTSHHHVPYSLTEEFVAVYRMHSLLPNALEIRSLTGAGPPRELPLDVGAKKTEKLLQKLGLADALYSFGTAHPGALTLHNFPTFLQRFERQGRDGRPDELLDVGAVDILRIRERGVPRYNEFRRLFNLKAPTSFLELTRNPITASELEGVYDGDMERVDLLIGLLAEPVPKGFAFGDTTFRVFLLMASRRLKSDRFFTKAYTPAVYTQAGLDWIEDTTLVKILRRHVPELEPALYGVDNAFKPWASVAQPPASGHEKRP